MYLQAHLLLGQFYWSLFDLNHRCWSSSLVPLLWGKSLPSKEYEEGYRLGIPFCRFKLHAEPLMWNVPFGTFSFLGSCNLARPQSLHQISHQVSICSIWQPGDICIALWRCLCRSSCCREGINCCIERLSWNSWLGRDIIVWLKLL